MNRHLMLSVAALLGCAGGARDAASQSIFFTGSSCPAIVLVKQGNTYNATYLENCSTVAGYGMGFDAQTNGVGRNVNLSDNFEAMNYGDYTQYLSFDLSLPLRNGGRWALWIGFSGTSNFEANSGKYRLRNAVKAGGQVAARTNAIIAGSKGRHGH